MIIGRHEAQVLHRTSFWNTMDSRVPDLTFPCIQEFPGRMIEMTVGVTRCLIQVPHQFDHTPKLEWHEDSIGDAGARMATPGIVISDAIWIEIHIQVMLVIVVDT